ncbi:MAG TPA: histidinol-phosphate transaminase [Thermomicrobiales bacterium]|nr:histidinol-phosphate transaminase [Thermomicrobiales bacterium]
MAKPITDFVRSTLTPVEGYTPGASRLTDRPVVRLDWNESPFPLTPKAQAALTRFTLGHRYPDYQQMPLREALADYVGFDPERIVPGAGLDDVFATLASISVEPGAEVIIAEPTFGVYRSLFSMLGATIVNVPLTQAPEFLLDTEAILNAVTGNTRLIILCNPNNPTGNLITRELIETIVDNVPCPVAIDEAYAEFSGQDHLDLARTRDNVIVLRTLSKFAGLAGFRVGYGIFPEPLLPYLRRVMPAFCNISGLSSDIAIASLQDLDILKQQRDLIVAERTRVIAALDAIPHVTPYPSATNFVLFRLPVPDSSVVLDALAARDIFVRRYGATGWDLQDCLRVSIGLPEENDAFLAALTDILRSLRTSGQTE